MYNTKDFPTAPTSWSVIYDSKYKGHVTVSDNPIQILAATAGQSAYTCPVHSMSPG